jgi:NAD(P)-dependent dehydrogenase (short-subunit alcohol dehydrogenase family)
MTMQLDGRAIALVCRGSEADRAIAVALAEAGANVALGTVTRAQDEEFATASIANEIWAMGREQFNRVLDAADPAAAAAFAAEVCDRLGRCDGLVLAPGPLPEIPFDELSRDEWDPVVAQTLTAWLFSAQAFARVIERGGGGVMVIAIDPGDQSPSSQALDAALAGATAGLRVAHAARGVHVMGCAPGAAAGRIIAVLPS